MKTRQYLSPRLSRLQKAEWESPVASMPGMNRRSLCGEVRGASAAARRCLTQMGKAAILGTDIRIRKGVHEANESPEDGKNEGAQGSQKADPHLFAGAPARGERRAGQAHPGASGSRAAVLQRSALRRAAAATPHASRSSVAGGPRHPPDT